MSNRERTRRNLARAGLLGVVLATALTTVPAQATPADRYQQQQEQEQDEQLAPVMVTLDASGSMTRETSAGETRMDAAKTALNNLIDGLDSTAQLGLQVYGTQTGESESEKAEGCQDIVTAQEVGPVDADALKRTVDGVEPSGFTPIGNALRAAADELPDEGPRAVVLISDGLDTCAPPDPCEVAEELADEGVDLSVHTVGFQVDDEAREQLSCIAEKSNGTYTDAGDAGSLEEQLPQVVSRAQRTYEAQGTPITGTEDYPQAPEIKAGQYIDGIDPNQTKYYRLNVPKDYTVHFAATTVIPNSQSNGVVSVETRLLDTAGKECESSSETEAMWVSHVTSTLSWVGEEARNCNAGDEVLLAVERSGPDDPEVWSYDLELLVTLEPPLRGAPGPEANTANVPFELPTGDERPVTGGGSFNDATELSGTGVYADELGPGEMATYKVNLDWGQSLGAQVNVDGRAIDEVLSVDVATRNSVRSPVSGNSTSSVVIHEEQESTDELTMPKVLYDNRNDSSAAAIAGWHYITVQAGTKEFSGTLPIRLYVNVAGEQAQGPQYAAPPEGQPGGLITDSGGEQGEGAGGPSEDNVVTAADTGSSIDPLWLWLSGGAIVAGAGLGAVLLIRRGRVAARAQEPPRQW
ncbi:Ca-activated chloride channel family protein [Prauserella marina]|uniref:Ca-activated chloride channel family protein n=1 Tax=Prauserella marina TaxID=530584 RepID=A0A1G6XBL0_9PSEU|nr:VWA domain-containing protein [Prauserella marina]PWV72633.1 Ca-activated chloride channel family protein [Prauserella marina]SDD75548.1 Ca-activated chloride channel family protein [Prauserella marina]